MSHDLDRGRELAVTQAMGLAERSSVVWVSPMTWRWARPTARH